MMMIIEEIKKFILQLTKEHLVLTPNPYATAWVSRIPQNSDLKKPQFPESLQWLYNHQMVDGTWGSQVPLNPFSNIISTLAVMLVLCQWNLAADKSRLIRAHNGLIQLSLQINPQATKPFGFELLLAVLVEELNQYYKLPQPVQKIFSSYVTTGKEQRDMLMQSMQQFHYQTPTIYWLCLEMYGGALMQDEKKSWPFEKSVLNSQGSIIGSVSASAYFLAAKRFRHQDCAKTLHYLCHLVQKGEGGVPPYHPMEQFELVFILDYFLKAKIPVSLLSNEIALLKKYWQQRGGLGYSSVSPSLDVDDTALGLIVLNQANEKPSIRNLMNFFNGEYFCHYQEDPTPSLSVNANVFRALQYYAHEAQAAAVLKKLLAFVEVSLKGDLVENLKDNWHLSPFYSASALIFAFAGTSEMIVTRLKTWLIEMQDKSGGFGYFDQVTMEETALAVLALAYLYHRSDSALRPVLIQAKKYLINCELKGLPEFYIGSTMVCPERVSLASILAARYALFYI